VRTLAGLPAPGADLEQGKKVYAETCVACHGADGRGKRDIGAPNLTDAIWLYGSDRATIIDGLWHGRGGMMPAWGGLLDESTIKALTIYVHTLGGGVR
jgi:cytochrome c oxidase cbb3-type subunit 3